jgi:ribosomal protein L11 methylase PrmA
VKVISISIFESYLILVVTWSGSDRIRLRFEVLLTFLIIGLAIWILWPIVIGAGWVPTPRDTIKKMLSLADVGPEDTVFDLGSGDGRIILMAALEFEANAVGIEADPLRVLVTKIKIGMKGLENQVKVIWGNFFKTDLSHASVITIYQSTEINNKLREKLLRELKSGTRVISYSFIFEGWEPIKVIDSRKLYLYEIISEN